MRIAARLNVTPIGTIPAVAHNKHAPTYLGFPIILPSTCVIEISVEVFHFCSEAGEASG